MATYCIGNFINDPSPNDRLIYIYNCGGVLTLSIDPYVSTFFNKSRYIYIVTDGKMNYDNVLDFSTNEESEQALARLNDVKKIFISRTNNALSGSVNKCEFYDHTGNTHLHLIPTLYDALTGATNPSSANTFATIADIVTSSGDTKEVKVSINDTNPGFLYQKISGSTYITLKIENIDSDEKLKIDAEGLTPLSFFETLTSNTYSKIETNSNFLSATTTVIDLSGYTTIEIDNLLTSYTLKIDFQNHTSDTSIHFTKDSILLDNLGDVDTGGTIDGYYLKYSAGTWIGAYNDAGVTIATLQTAYNNSISPEITLDETRGSLDLRSYVGGDTATTFTIQNSNSDINAYIRADGFAKFYSVSASTYYGDGSNLKGIHVKQLSDISILNEATGNTLMYSAGTWVNSMYDWNYIIHKPTTLNGYGITDSYTKSQSDSNYMIKPSVNTITYAANIIIDWSIYQTQIITLTGDCSFTNSGGTAGKLYHLKVIQDGTGGHIISFSSMKYPGAVAPVLTSTANAIDILTILYDGTNYNLIGVAFDVK